MSDTIKATVLWSNLWTSAGKCLEGAAVDLPKEEADNLKALGAVKLPRQKKAKKEDPANE